MEYVSVHTRVCQLHEGNPFSVLRLRTQTISELIYVMGQPYLWSKWNHHIKWMSAHLLCLSFLSKLSIATLKSDWERRLRSVGHHNLWDCALLTFLYLTNIIVANVLLVMQQYPRE